MFLWANRFLKIVFEEFGKTMFFILYVILEKKGFLLRFFPNKLYQISQNESSKMFYIFKDCCRRFLRIKKIFEGKTVSNGENCMIFLRKS